MNIQLNNDYKTGFLLNGVYDGEKIEFNRKRYFLNLIVDYAAKFIFLTHLIVFIFDFDFIKKHFILFKISDGFGSRFMNLSKLILMIIISLVS